MNRLEDKIILSSEERAVVNQMKKLGRRVGNILGKGDHKHRGTVARASTHVLGQDSEPEWLECRGKESLGQEGAGAVVI